MAPQAAKEPAFEEPKIKWKKSNARALLLEDLCNGLVPLEAKDNSGKSTMKLKDIYAMRPEYAAYDYKKFLSRLSAFHKYAIEGKKMH